MMFLQMNRKSCVPVIFTVIAKLKDYSGSQEVIYAYQMNDISEVVQVK